MRLVADGPAGVHACLYIDDVLQEGVEAVTIIVEGGELNKAVVTYWPDKLEMDLPAEITLPENCFRKRRWWHR